MLKKQKLSLPDRISKLTLKTKSFVFMKIFMSNTMSPMRFQKIRHYDLQLQGATAIESCLKTRLQQIYLRSFYQIKNHKAQQKQFGVDQQQNSVSLASLRSQSNIRKVSNRFGSQTNRSAYQKSKVQAHISNKGTIIGKGCLKGYRSECGVQNQQSQSSKRSDLQKLLHKVREANSQSKIEKQNFSRSGNYQVSYQQSRVISAGGYPGHGVCNQKQYRIKACHTQHQTTPNDMSFCTYNQQKGRMKALSYVKQQVPPYDSTNSYINIEKQASIDKSNLSSLRKWHKNQKRKIIMQKMKDLQNSLFHRDPRRSEYLYNEYDENSYVNLADSGTHLFPLNYSQAYLNYKFRQPTRSENEVRLRNGLKKQDRNY